MIEDDVHHRRSTTIGTRFNISTSLVRESTGKVSSITVLELARSGPQLNAQEERRRGDPRRTRRATRSSPTGPCEGRKDFWLASVMRRIDRKTCIIRRPRCCEANLS